MAFQPVGVKAIVQGAQAFNQQIGAMSTAVTNFGTGVSGVGTRISGFGQTLSGIGRGLSLGLTLPILAGGGAIASAGIQYEDFFMKIGNLTDASQADIQQWGSQILSLAPQLGKTPLELADALFAITSAGASGSMAMDILTQSAKASAIGLGETGVIARATLAAVTAYGEENLSAARATDILAAIVKTGNVEAAEIAPTMGRVVGLAAELGISFEELGAFIATYTRLGVDASEATTSLSGVMNTLIKPSEQATAVLGQMGMSMQDVRDMVGEQGLSKTLQFLLASVDGNAEALGDLFPNVRALAGALGTAGSQGEAYLEVLKGIEDSTGLVDTAFQDVTQTTSFQVGQLKALFQSLAIGISDALLPLITSIVQFLTPLVQKFIELLQANPIIAQLIVGFGLLLAAIGPVILIAGAFFSAVGTIISVVGAAIGAVGALISPFLLLLVPIAAVGAAIIGLAGLFAASFSRISSVSQSRIGGLINSLREWGRKTILAFAEGMAAALQAVIMVLQQLGSIIASFLRAFSPPPLLPDLPTWGEKAMQSYLDGWLAADFGIFKEIGGTIQSFIESLPTSVLPEDQVIPRILGTRSAIMAAIDQFKATGVIAEESLQKIFRAAGITDAGIQKYVRTMFELQKANKAVAIAQAEVEKINAKFAETLKPITRELESVNAELQAIRDRRQDASDAREMATIDQALASGRLTAEERQLAMERKRELELQRQQRSLQAQEADAEKKRDTELEAANEKLKIAQDQKAAIEAQIAAQKEMIDIQRENNDLIKRQIALMESLAESGGGGGGGAGGAGGLGEGLAGIGGINPEDFFGGMDGLGDLGLEDMGLDLEEAFGPVEDLISEITGKFSGLSSTFENLRTTWGGVWDEVIRIGTDFVNWVTTDLVPIAQEGLGTIGDKLATSWNETWKPALTELYDWLMINLPLAGETLGEFFRGDLATAFSGVFDWVMNSLLPVFADLGIAWLENIPTAITQMITFVDEVLIPGFNRVWAFIQDYIVPIFNTVSTVLGIGVPAAGQTLTSFWNDVMLPALNTIWLFVQDNIIPIFTSLATFWSVILTAAVQAIVDLWNEAFMPALTVIWSFVTDNIIPLFEALNTLIGVTVLKAFEGLGVLFETIFMPILNTIWSFLSDTFNPIFKALGDYITNILVPTIRDDLIGNAQALKNEIQNGVGPKVQWFKDSVLGPLKSSLDSVAQFVQAIIDKLVALADKIASIDFGLLEPGSPTPFEIGIRGISAAMDELAEKKIPYLKGQIKLLNSANDLDATLKQSARPAMISSAALIPSPPIVNNATSRSYNQSQSFGDTYINTPMDEATFRTKLVKQAKQTRF